MSHASRRRAPALIPTLLPPEGGEELNHGGGNVFPLCFQSRVGVRVAHCIEDGCFSENRCFLALTLPLTRVPPLYEAWRVKYVVTRKASSLPRLASVAVG